METWRKVWRQGVAPQLSDAGLGALYSGLVSDDEGLLQGSTTSPPPLMCVQEWAVEGACPIGYCGWQGDGLQTVGEVEEYFARACFNIDQTLGEPAVCRFFLNWWDDAPRGVARAELLAEVQLEIKRRAALAA